MIVAKDAKGVRKSLGGDVFKASWVRVGGTEPAVSARVCPITQLSSPKSLNPTFHVQGQLFRGSPYSYFSLRGTA